MTSQNRSRPAGFTLFELLLVVAIVGILVSILLPALSEARRTARLTLCLASMQQMGTATQTYALDFQDRIDSFTWKAGEVYEEADDDLKDSHTDDVNAGAHQAVHIIRRRADRPDMRRPEGWIPHVLYTYLVLLDYLQARLPEAMVVCPEHWRRLNWQDDPQNKFDNGFWLPDQPLPSPGNKRWAYSSSYQTVPAAFDRLQSVWSVPDTCGLKGIDFGAPEVRTGNAGNGPPPRP